MKPDMLYFHLGCSRKQASSYLSTLSLSGKSELNDMELEAIKDFLRKRHRSRFNVSIK